MNIYVNFYAAYNAAQKAGSTLMKEDLVSDFTKGRTISLKDCSPLEIGQMAALLRQQVPEKFILTPGGRKADNMRKAIIAIFRSIGHTVQHAIAWAEKQGVEGVKKGFNDYTTQELYVLIQLAEKVKTDYQASLRKTMTRL